MAKTHIYSGADLDRLEHIRRDPAWFERARREGRLRLVAIWRDQNLFSPVSSGPETLGQVHFLDPEQLPAPQDHELLLLGRRGDELFVALDLSARDDPHAALGLEAGTNPGVDFSDLRANIAGLARPDAALLAFARGLAYWHRRHAFCGLCGSPTHSASAGHERRCDNPTCMAVHFPRTDPAVIMLVHDGARCLLGRQASWPPGRHSTLAGFVEPGESLEEAVAREVYEESGLRVDQVRYHSSQPWPFPSSIMLGFHARAVTTEITVNKDELESARWFSREELLAPETASFMPSRDSIARQLIADWLESPSI